MRTRWQVGGLALVVIAVPLVACKAKETTSSPPAGSSSVFGPPSASGKAAECAAVRARAQAEMEVHWEQAPKTCARDADCIAVDRSACLSIDCGRFVIARSAASSYEAARRQVDQTTCARFHELDCSVVLAIPLPSCVPPGPACRAGVCVDGR